MNVNFLEFCIIN